MIVWNFELKGPKLWFEDLRRLCLQAVDLRRILVGKNSAPRTEFNQKHHEFRLQFTVTLSIVRVSPAISTTITSTPDGKGERRGGLYGKEENHHNR
jgi:hypothetical protein